jgi:hypothetical protein
MRLRWIVIAVSLIPAVALAQQLSQRLILKDGSYQLFTKMETDGERIRYLSAERNDWEEVPNSLVDWEATHKYEKDRVAGVPVPEAVALDKELAAERAADEAGRPEVAPGLRLPDEGTVFLLDTFKTQPQLVEIQQNGGIVDPNSTSNILHAAINPIATAKRPIELDGAHASIHAHTALPSIYVNVNQNAETQGPQKPQQPEKPQQPLPDWERFHIIRAQSKRDKRVIANVKISVLGKTSEQQDLVATTAQQLTGGWVKITPVNALPRGEYVVAEALGSAGINLYVWDFNVDPDAPANGQVTQANQPSPQKSGDALGKPSK